MTRTIPIDSTDARELREAEAEREAAARAADLEHAEHCHGGWLGVDDDGRPRPCRRCRPHLFPDPCSVCSQTRQTCEAGRAHRHGPCCDHCTHRPPWSPA